MNIFFRAIEAAATFNEIFIFLLIERDMLWEYSKKKFSWRTNIIIGILYVILISACNSISLFVWFTPILGILFMSVASLFLYKVSYLLTASLSGFYILCLGFWDLFVITMIGTVLHKQETVNTLVFSFGWPRVYLLFLLQGMWILFYLALRKTFQNFSLHKNYIWKLFWISVLGLAGWFYMTDHALKAFDPSISSVSFVMLAIIMLFFVGSSLYYEKNAEQKELEMAAVKSQLYEEKYKSIQSVYVRNAKIYHDVKNHLNTLYHMKGENSEEEVKHYIEQISEPLRSLENSVWTGINIVDVILNTEFSKMKDMGIMYQADIDFPNNIEIQPNDLCTILSNLLDNAIEAVHKLQSDGPIKIKIRRVQGFLIIKVENPCASDLRVTDNHLVTTKSDKLEHGFGLANIEDAIKKYEGKMKLTAEDGIFTAMIMLF